MNILIVSQMGLDSRTGVKTYYLNLRDQFIKQGHNVTIITVNESPIGIKIVLKTFRKLALFFFPSDFIRLFVGEFFYFISFFFAVRKIRKKKWDIVHGQEASSTYAAKLALKGKVPVVTTCHYNDSPVLEFKSMYKLSEKQLQKVEKWFKYHISKCGNYIFVSNYVYNKSESLFNKPIYKKIIPNGVAFPSLKDRELPAGQFVISNVGTIEDRKNQKLLIEAAVRLAKQKFDFKIWFLGDGPKREELEQMVEKEKLENHITFWGFKKDRLEIISKSDMYIHTALNENCSFSITEAFSLGLPVMALKTGGIPEQFPESEAGLLSADISPDELAKSIITYSANEERRKMQRDQYKNAGKFTINRMATETLSFYKKIIANTR